MVYVSNGVTVWTRLTPVCFSPQSFNAPPRSKMKLWKGATLAFMLCGAALSLVLVRNMAALGQLKTNSKYPHTPTASHSKASSRSQSTSSSRTKTKEEAETLAVSRTMGGLRRRSRSADDMNSLLSECKINSFFPLFFVGCVISCDVECVRRFNYHLIHYVHWCAQEQEKLTHFRNK